MRSYTAGLIGAVVTLAGLCGLAPPSWASDRVTLSAGAASSASAADVDSPVFEFDIPALPLATALSRFSDVSGRSAVFPGTLLAGRHSSPVLGRYTATVGLQHLLEGSGLEFEEIRSGKLTALVLKPAVRPAAIQTAAPTDPSNLDGYESLTQARIWDAICAHPSTANDSYRSLLRFSVDATGRIHQPRLLSSTGDASRDAALLGALQRVGLGRAPPSGMRQPLTMLILPAQAGGPVCSNGAAP